MPRRPRTQAAVADRIRGHAQEIASEGGRSYRDRWPVPGDRSQPRSLLSRYPDLSIALRHMGSTGDSSTEADPEAGGRQRGTPPRSPLRRFSVTTHVAAARHPQSFAAVNAQRWG